MGPYDGSNCVSASAGQETPSPNSSSSSPSAWIDPGPETPDNYFPATQADESAVRRWGINVVEPRPVGAFRDLMDSVLNKPIIVPEVVKKVTVVDKAEVIILPNEIKTHFIGICRDKRKVGQMWFDTGCRRSVCGPEGHREMQRELERYGLKPIRHDKTEEFVFGDGETCRSSYSYEYPVFMSGHWVGNIDIAMVPVPCPPLFSLGMAKQWKCRTDHENDTIHIGVFNHTINFTDTPYVNIFEKTKDGKMVVSDCPRDFKDTYLDFDNYAGSQ
jgi:hypothetical protein